MRSVYFIALFLCCALDSFAQINPSYPGIPRYPEGMFSIGFGGGGSKYIGEFVDGHIGQQTDLSLKYAFSPVFNLSAHFSYGKLLYLRRLRDEAKAEYELQFKGTQSSLRSTEYTTSDLRAVFNLFPRQYLNIYLFAGFGISTYAPQDFEGDLVTEKSTKEVPWAFTVPLGFGAEYFINKSLALYSELGMNFIFADDVDAFASGWLRDTYHPTARNPVSEANDGYAALNAGIRMYLFENRDIDADLLLNAEEEQIGSNPYAYDTDADGLGDYEEARIFHTNPRLSDTDYDGLTDLEEVRIYRTNPMLPDTDLDGLNDGDEVLQCGTNPRENDSDYDGIADHDELHYGTDPREADTDHDGLSDSEEIFTYKTNPARDDSDQDGLIDSKEITLRTDPWRADTDADGLSDYAGVALFHTNPLRRDTDGDGIIDAEELFERGTDPLKSDTDGDGIPDLIDKCPTLPETYNEYQDGDGCPDTRGPTITQFPIVPAAPDTVIIREGASFTLFGVNFESAKAVLRPESIPILEANADLFHTYPALEVEIRGHTDNRGGLEYNDQLSMSRAQVVKNYLTGLGVASHRMSVKGFAYRLPIASNDTPFGRARNRRIEFFITKEGPRKSADQLSNGTVVPSDKKP